MQFHAISGPSLPKTLVKCTGKIWRGEYAGAFLPDAPLARAAALPRGGGRGARGGGGGRRCTRYG